MKTYKYCLVLLAAFVFFACEKETEGISTTTYYCDLTLKGNPVEWVFLGQEFKEPGYVALENGVDVSEHVTIAGTVDGSKTGIYKLNYSIKNSDGFPKNDSRIVIVSDPTASAIESGFYKVSKQSSRTKLNTGPGATGSKEYKEEPVVLIYQVSPGKFYCSDFLGGYYEVGKGYGPQAAMTGHFLLDPNDNTISLSDSFIAAWKDGLDAIVNGVYDPATKTIKFTAQYASLFDFNIILTK